MDAHKPFHFYTRLNQTELLGRNARNVVELLEGIKAVPDSSIYQHAHRILDPSSAARVLHDRVVGPSRQQRQRVEFCDHVLRVKVLGKRRETTNIGEHDRNASPDATNHERLEYRFLH